MGQLRIEVSQSDVAPEITILRFEGELDNASIRDISSSFRLIIEKNSTYVVADMSKVSMLSSAALGEIMGGRKALVEHGGDLALACLSLPIKTKLTLLGANRIFKLHSDIRSAVSAYKWEFEGKPEVFTLSVPPHLRFVPPVRQFASRLSSLKGYSRRDSFRIETIVDELCNNAIEHAPPHSMRNVSLIVSIDRRKVEINVINASDPEKLVTLKQILNGTPESAPPISDDRRGRGLALVRLLSNRVDIEYSEQGTRVHATKLKEE